MSIDIILHAANKAAMVVFAKAHPPANPLMNVDGETREGVEYVWWSGSGKFKTANGTYDAEGVEITPPTYLSGVALLMRIHGQFFTDNVINEGDEQWQRNQVAKYIKTNGTSGSMGGIPYYELDGVRLFRPTDVESFIASAGVPGHEWLGGNSY